MTYRVLCVSALILIVACDTNTPRASEQGPSERDAPAPAVPDTGQHEPSAPLQPAVAYFTEFLGNLHLLDTLTGTSTRITGLGLPMISGLAYSPATRLLALAGSPSEEDPPSLYLLDLSDSSTILIRSADLEPLLHRPVFDPAGANLYALDYSGGIHRFSLASRAWSRVRVHGADGLNPQALAFSPSGHRVAISPGGFDGFLIGSVSDSGITVADRTLADFERCISPAWVSEDRLVFAGRTTPGSQQIWSVDLASGHVAQITQPPVAARDFLSLSPDRRMIVFTGAEGEQPVSWGLWQISLDGSGLKQLTTGGVPYSHLGPVYVR